MYDTRDSLYKKRHPKGHESLYKKIHFAVSFICWKISLLPEKWKFCVLSRTIYIIFRYLINNIIPIICILTLILIIILLKTSMQEMRTLNWEIIQKQWRTTLLLYLVISNHDLLQQFVLATVLLLIKLQAKLLMPLRIAAWLWPLMKIMQRYALLKSLQSGEILITSLNFVS